MSSSYDSSRSRRRGAWAPWVPLVLTVAVASAGVAAWVWNQRARLDDSDDDESAHAHLDYEHADYGENPPYGATGDRNLGTSVNPAADRAESVTYGVTEDAHETGSNAGSNAGSTAGSGWGMPSAWRRTPSPHNFLSNAGRTIAAGASVVGTAMGSALAAIREEDKNAYADHETWSEEAEARKNTKQASPSPPPSQVSTRRRKTVAVVVSADSGGDDFSDDGFHEHASILSHVPRNTDFSSIKLFVLVYSPGLKESALDAQTGAVATASLSSSFSNIDQDNAHTPGSEKSQQLKSTADSAFTALYSQALALVEKETMVMPFTSPNGHVHILRHLQPEVVYLQESLAGDNGNYVMQLQTWLRYDVILIVGADGSGGGLADSDSEAPEKTEEKEDVWWEREERVGRGRGVVVVDSLMVSDDWERRVQGKE